MEINWDASWRKPLSKIILNRLAARFHEPGAVLLLLLQQMRHPLPIRRTSRIQLICLVEHDKSLPRGVRVAIQIIELRPPAISALHLLEKWA